MLRTSVPRTVGSWVAGTAVAAAVGILLAASPRVAVAQDAMPALTPAVIVSERTTAVTAAAEHNSLHAAGQAMEESQTLQNETQHHAANEESRAENGY